MSVFADLDRPRAVFATEGRKAEVFKRFVADLEAHGGYSDQIEEVCQNMSEFFLAGALEHLPDAEITFDRYHVAAEHYLRRWVRGAKRSQLAPIIDFAKMVEEYWLGILRWFSSKVSNGLLEGQYIAMIYLVAGKLDFGATHAK